MRKDNETMMEYVARQKEEEAAAFQDYADKHNAAIKAAEAVPDDVLDEMERKRAEQRKAQEREEQKKLDETLSGWGDDDKLYGDTSKLHAVNVDEQKVLPTPEEAYKKVYDLGPTPILPAEKEPEKDAFTVVDFGVALVAAKKVVFDGLLDAIKNNGIFSYHTDAALEDVEKIKRLDDALQYMKQTDSKKKINLKEQ